MIKRPKFSIIVPVYKAEVFIEKCINGILAQTVYDFELILINDGSPDRSGEICEEYALKDTRIKVFHKKNGGPSSARNVGLDNSIGEIVCFVDCDDNVAPEFLENFGQCDSDITVQAFYAKRINEKDYTFYSIKDSAYDYEKISSFTNIIIEALNTGYLFTRAFKRKIIKDNKLRFNERFRVREDEEFIWRYMLHCHTFTTVNKSAYYYYMPNFAEKYSFVDFDSDFECTKSIISSCVCLLKEANNPIITYNANRLAAIIVKSYRNKDFNIFRTKEYLKTFCNYYNSDLSIVSKLIYFVIGTHTPPYMHKMYNLLLSWKPLNNVC